MLHLIFAFNIFFSIQGNLEKLPKNSQRLIRSLSIDWSRKNLKKFNISPAVREVFGDFAHCAVREEFFAVREVSPFIYLFFTDFNFIYLFC